MVAFMNRQKLSISLPQQQYEFLEDYQSDHEYKTRSEVISLALRLLQQAQLEASYKEANEELNDDFLATDSDGIEDDEAW